MLSRLPSFYVTPVQRPQELCPRGLRAGPLSGTEGQYRALDPRPEEAWQLVLQPLGVLFQEQAGHPGSPPKSPEKAHASHAWWSRGQKCPPGSELPAPWTRPAVWGRGLSVTQPSVDCILKKHQAEVPSPTAQRGWLPALAW